MNQAFRVPCVFVSLSLASAAFQGCVPRRFGSSGSRQSVTVSSQNAPSPQRVLSPLDVSFLFPLESDKFKFPLSEGPAAPGKTLITEETYDSLGTFVTKKDAGLRPGGFGGGPSIAFPYEYPNFRVIAFRFDPCGGEKVPADLDISKGCAEPLIRLVAQPMAGGTALDQAMHLIYRFNRSETEKILAGLEALKAQGEKLTGETTDRKPLGIHPSLKALDFRSKGAATTGTSVANSVLFANAARDFILSWCSKDKLVSVATMVGGFRGGSTVNQWAFKVNAIVDGLSKGQPITGVDQTQPTERENPPFTLQTFFNDIQGGNRFTLSPVFSKDMQTYIDQQKLHIEVPSGTADDFLILKRRALLEAARIENPQTVKVTEGDCVSCHLTTRVLLRSHENTKYPLGAEAQHAIKAVTFQSRASVSGMNMISKEDLANKLEGNMLLNFGYRMKVISISQRTANETAEIVALLNALANK